MIRTVAALKVAVECEIAILNKGAEDVHERPEAGAATVHNSENMTETKKRAVDQRTRRTQQKLGVALMQLIQERPGEEITVQEVLDRAAVGRSTFYVHFRDKDDLLFSQLEQFLQIFSTLLSTRKEQSRRVVAVREMFEHVAEQQKLWRGIVASGRIEDFFNLAQDFFTRGIQQRLKELKAVSSGQHGEVRIRSVALAGSLLALLRWWMDRGAKEPAADMDRIFHATLWEGIQARVGP